MSIIDVTKLEALARAATKGERIVSEMYYDGPLYYVNVLKGPDEEMTVSVTSAPEYLDEEARVQMSVSSTLVGDGYVRLFDQDRADAEYIAALDPDVILRILQVLRGVQVFARHGKQYGHEARSEKSVAGVLNYHEAMFHNIIAVIQNLGINQDTDEP